MAEKKTISQKARNKSFLSWIYGNLTCFSQEHMQTFGYLASMLPIVDELYDTDDQKVRHFLPIQPSLIPSHRLVLWLLA